MMRAVSDSFRRIHQVSDVVEQALSSQSRLQVSVTHAAKTLAIRLEDQSRQYPRITIWRRTSINHCLRDEIGRIGSCGGD